MRKNFFGAAILASLASATPAQAEDSAKQFMAKIDGPDQLEADLLGMVLAAYGTGISWANLAAEQKNGERLYCQPEKLVLTNDQKVDMVRRYIKKFPEHADRPAGLVVFMTLLHSFPCKKPDQ